MRVLRRFFARWQNWIGLVIVFLFMGVAIAAPVLSPMDPEDPGTVKTIGNPLEFEPQLPSPEAPLGTLSDQSSVYHSLIWGCRSAMIFGLVVAGFALLMGVIIGAISGYFGGPLNDFMMRVTDSFLAFPLIAGIVFIKQIFTTLLYNAGVRYMTGGYGGLLTTTPTTMFLPEEMPFWLTQLQKIDPVILAFMLFSWMPFARLMNTMVLEIKNTEYIEAAKALGVKNRRIIFRHILPNAISPLVVMAARDIGGVVLLQTTFTFIGIGGDSPWGTMLAVGRDWVISPGGIFTYWWVFIPATVAIILFGIGWNLVGDGLNDALNPRVTETQF